MNYCLLKKNFLRWVATTLILMSHSTKAGTEYGSGKTFSGSLLGIILCLKYPGIRGLVGAQTYVLVRDTTLVSYFEHLERMGLQDGVDFNYLKAESKLVFSNKSEILFRHLEEPDKLKSLNLGFV